MTAGPETAGAAPVERFRPTSGRLVGWTGIAIAAGLVVFLALNVHTMAGLRIGLGLVFFAVLVWATQLRPRAAASPHSLHLRNSFRDTTIPLLLIDDAVVRRTLNVWVGDERYICIGIGQPLRAMVKVKTRGPSALLGFDRIESYTESSTPPMPDQSAMSYQSFVESRIAVLVEEAKRTHLRRHGGTAPAHLRPRHEWAWPELVALAVTGAAFLGSFFL